ncbi:hypothetical protein Lal_00016557 [Lupinus albus]|uniref:Uncharacterized protein n=1 Tax=Lupinus albus TaxID=3870 RepID=A0A6A4QHM0_LUPAL|nr:hypothetical protein Lalb_Chr05g0222471 [Lupinus albus]KAF1872720.1 hypothetical protein Lal_00016557 [Lupinus albus]
MSPTPFHPKTEITMNNLNKGMKTNRVSHSIKKTPLSSLPPNNQQHRQPVIIYTHSPKIIETHPKDFMALVQKLTGLSHDHSEDKDEEANTNSCFNPLPQLPPPKHKPLVAEVAVDVKYPKEENEMPSVITNDNQCDYSCMGEVKSCFTAAPPMMMEPPLMPYMRSLPVIEPNSVEFMCSNKPFLNYPEPFFL